LPEDIPLPPDATGMAEMFGMMTFQSPSTPQEVADFYQTEMPNNGWTEVSADSMGDVFMLQYTKDSRTAELMISADADTGETGVMLTVTTDG
jgi:hypothetical protein